MASLAQRVVGSWMLVSYGLVGPDGTETLPAGSDIIGLISYMPDGVLSVHLMRPGRPHWAGIAVMGGSPEERESAAAGYFAYAGRWTADEGTSTLFHDLALALVPNMVGTRQVRHARLDGDLLELTSPPDATGAIQRIVWRRAAAPAR